MFVLLSALAALGAPVADVLTGELDLARRAFEGAEEPVHYMALAVTRQRVVTVSASDATIDRDSRADRAWLDVDLRVGAPELDSSRPLRGFSSLEGSSRDRMMIPYEAGNDEALRVALWSALDTQYRGASQRMVMIRAERTVKVEEEVEAPDFEPRQGLTHTSETPSPTLDTAAWRAALAELSDRVDAARGVQAHELSVTLARSETTFIDTEGAHLQHGRAQARLAIQLFTVAEDGDRVSVYRAFDAHDPARLPDLAALRAWTDDAVRHLEALRVAPRGTPYTGPVVLEGRAAAVFFHEVFGHRVEGHRQKREWEGRTFAAKIGEPILPDFLDVYDDPTIARWGETDLNGYYTFDDEGVAAERAELVREGRFVGFLMSRSPLPDHAHSNGHGRRQPGNAPVARMGNTIVHARKAVSPQQLRAQLLAEVRKQGLEYGYVVSDIDGGFTLTGRMMPNSFNVRANTTWRVFADGRPDELVRGIDLVGTPLVAFRNVVAASTDVQVFNGSCGAESGWVPVSAVAPGLLVRSLEFQLKEKGQERPPLLPKPDAHGGTAWGDDR
jgi:TldD protein